MTTVWIASMVLQWLVIAVLCVLILSVIRQIGELNLRLNGLRDRDNEEGPTLYSRLPPHQVTLIDKTPTTVGGNEGERPWLLVFFSPSCAACEALPAALAQFVREPGGIETNVLAVISTDRADAARFVIEKSLGHVAVAAKEDFPDHYIPGHGVPFAIALGAGGIVAARGKPKTLQHLREMAHAARHMAERVTTNASRDHEWGQSIPYGGKTQTSDDGATTTAAAHVMAADNMQ